jgi:uncharacterized protein
LGKNVRILAQLQEIDLRIDCSRGEKQGLQDQISSLETKAAEMNQGISEQVSEQETLEQEKCDLEKNLDAESDAIARSEARLRDIKTQKEYQAVSKEIAAAKKVKGEIEEQVLQRTARGEELKALIEDKEKELQEFEQASGIQKRDLQSKIERLDAEINNDLVAREAIVKNISTSMMKRYATLREKRQGLAIVEAKAGSCLGCNMNLPPQVYNSLFKAENLISCPHCQRILYLCQEDDGATV